MIHISPATLEDIEYLVPRLRREDVDEIHAMGQTPEQGLPQSYACSTTVLAIRSTAEQSPFAVFGVAPSEADPQLGVVWFLGTPDVSKHRKDLLTHAKYGWLPHWRNQYPKGLHNFVDDRNTAMLKWCQLVGFDIIQTVHVGPYTFSHIHYV